MRGVPTPIIRTAGFLVLRMATCMATFWMGEGLKKRTRGWGSVFINEEEEEEECIVRMKNGIPAGILHKSTPLSSQPVNDRGEPVMLLVTDE